MGTFYFYSYCFEKCIAQAYSLIKNTLLLFTIFSKRLLSSKKLVIIQRIDYLQVFHSIKRYLEKYCTIAVNVQKQILSRKQFYRELVKSVRTSYKFVGYRRIYKLFDQRGCEIMVLQSNNLQVFVLQVYGGYDITGY